MEYKDPVIYFELHQNSTNTECPIAIVGHVFTHRKNNILNCLLIILCLDFVFLIIFSKVDSVMEFISS